jgi:competence protein ComEA
MKKSSFFNGWSLAVILLALIIIAGGIFIMVRAGANPGIEITLTPVKDIEGRININGEVRNPGLYPVFAGDTLEDIIRAAGGFSDGADAGMIELTVAEPETSSQKIDLNRAEAWLLEAVPGVGEVKAQAVIDYRQAHGYFHSIEELLNVPGFSETVLSKITGLVTVHE